MFKRSKFFRNSRVINSVICLSCLTGAMFLYSAGVYAEVVLPTNGNVLAGNGHIANTSENVMDITGLDNTVIKWDSFNIGARGIVNFKGQNGFNVLNYVNSAGGMSKIYGVMNGEGGNVYLVNPSGVFISSAASIDVGSLYVSNRKIDAIENGTLGASPNINELVKNAGPASGAELMLLGNVTANSITFDGDRIVIDTKQDTTSDSQHMGALDADSLNIITTDKDNVVVGYTAYDDKDGYAGKNNGSTKLANIQVRDASGSIGSASELTTADGYMWVNNISELQALNTNLSGKYALHNGIDASHTEEGGDKSFTPIGSEDAPFTGTLDGLNSDAIDDSDYAIFDLNIEGENNVGLFGVTKDAKLRNLTLSYGNVTGEDNVGALVGYAQGGEISNVRNSVNVTGRKSVGGLVGNAENVKMQNLMNTGTVVGDTNREGCVYTTTSVFEGNYTKSSSDSDTGTQADTSSTYNKDFHLLFSGVDSNGYLVYDDGTVVKVDASTGQVLDKDSDTGTELHLDRVSTYEKSTTTTTKTCPEEVLNEDGSINKASSGVITVTEVTESHYRDEYQFNNLLQDTDHLSGAQTIWWCYTSVRTTTTWTESPDGTKSNVITTKEYYDDGSYANLPQLKYENGDMLYYYCATRSAESNMTYKTSDYTSTKNTVAPINDNFSNQIGGVVGVMTNGSLDGATNIGPVNGYVNDQGQAAMAGNDYTYNVGGVIGLAKTTSGEAINLSNLENDMGVIGGYNVGGVIGSLDTSNGGSVSLDGATNEATILAQGNIVDDYTYSQGNTGNANDSHQVTQKVDVSNVGGIIGNLNADGTIANVSNYGDISSAQQTEYDADTDTLNVTQHYIGGNVGGIVGKAQSVSGTSAALVIKDALNKENTIRGAHNVGGIVGDLHNAKLDGAENNGSDIMGTGARYLEADNASDETDDYVKETLRLSASSGQDCNIIGNIGGIAGYAHGSDVQVNAASNSGNIHSYVGADGESVDNIQEAQATSVGGIVGKLDTDRTYLSAILKDEATPSITESYNTGVIQGYIGVGGIVGMMYNGSVAHSYNAGNILSTRNNADNASIPYVNLGGIVGDATEFASNWSVLYDVYNTGTIGDPDFVYGARHTGGIAGRFQGDFYQVYNTADIYNNTSCNGGIVGYWTGGTMNMAYNTGNVTTLGVGQDGDSAGIVGTMNMSAGSMLIANVYNLGTIRSFYKGGNPKAGGIIAGRQVYGYIIDHPDKDGLSSLTGTVYETYQDYLAQRNLTIANVYTTGNIFIGDVSDDYNKGFSYISNSAGQLPYDNGIYSGNYQADTHFFNCYYIPITDTSGNALLGVDDTKYFNEELDYKSNYAAEDGTMGVYIKTGYNGTEISTANMYDSTYYAGFDFGTTWRMYEGTTTPMLNAFLPTLATRDESYNKGVSTVADSATTDASGNTYTIQYGTAYNPLLTLVTYDANANNAVYDVDWNNGSENSLNYLDSIAVYNGGLSISNMDNGDNYYSGTLYATDTLTISGTANSDLLLGVNAKLYAGDIEVNSSNKLIDYGDTYSAGGIMVSVANDIELIGKISAGDTTKEYIAGLGNFYYDPKTYGTDGYEEDEHITELNSTVKANYKTTSTTNGVKMVADIPNIGNWYHAEMPTSTSENKITITSANGNVQALYGVRETGFMSAADGISISAKNSIYVDSDLKGAIDLTLNASTTDDHEREIVLDLSNIGGTEANAGATVYDYVNDNAISLSGTDNAMITLDFWNGETNAFDTTKYDTDQGLFGDLLNSTDNIDVATLTNGNIKGMSAVYAWISDGEQLDAMKDLNAAEAVKFNYALKNDIDASKISDYQAFGGDDEYVATFNGRNKKIVDLDAEADDNGNAGLFAAIGEKGLVKNLKVYSSSAIGANAGAIAVSNAGTIDNIETFGNKVEGQSVAGGIVGMNLDTGVITKINSNDVVFASDQAEEDGSVGGVVATNEGVVGNAASEGYDIFVNSAVLSHAPTMESNDVGIGGIVGSNFAEVNSAQNIGIVNASRDGEVGSRNVGGIVGMNIGGTVDEVLNLAHVTGTNDVGGVVGEVLGGTISNAANAGRVTGLDIGDDDTSVNVGGIAGAVNFANVNTARNSGDVSGDTNVGGMFGSVDAQSVLENIVNDGFVKIEGIQFVGGVVGDNAGTLDVGSMGLENKGVIYGNQYVGGIAGRNTGEILNPQANVNLYTVAVEDQDASYFGGVAGLNEGTITKAANIGTIEALGAKYVGGVVGKNAENGILTGASNAATGRVVGAQQVGGVIGYNEGKVEGLDGAEATITNEGIVIATNGGAGGIFGVNNSDMSNVTLLNNGVVLGNSTIVDGVQQGSGGIAGVNYGVITDSTVGGGVNAIVGDTNNAGGIFGVNYGSISGSRDNSDYDSSVYYKNAVYNNGIVKVAEFESAAYADSTKSEILFAGKKWDKTPDNANAGGLVGYNSGTVARAYNTGKVTGGMNIGGIVGYNEGTVSEVFNNVFDITERDEDALATELGAGSVSGTVSVGGIVGYNAASGKVKYAYNISDVDLIALTDSDASDDSSETASESTVQRARAKARAAASSDTSSDDLGLTGNLVGTNKGEVTQSYAENTTGTLIGNGNLATESYTLSEADANNATYISAEDSLSAASYTDITTDDGTTDNGVWKIYDGYTTPMLKVFLTRTSNTLTAEETLTADEFADVANDYSTVDALIASEQLTTEHPEDFYDYDNHNDLINLDTDTEVGDTLTNADGSTEQTTTYKLALYSKQNGYSNAVQVASATDEDGVATASIKTIDPNLLGYDLDDTEKQVNVVTMTPGSDNPDPNKPEDNPDPNKPEDNPDPNKPDTDKLLPPLPPLPEDVHENHSHENHSAGKDRQRRERKAELNFVKGGMVLPEEAQAAEATK